MSFVSAFKGIRLRTGALTKAVVFVLLSAACVDPSAMAPTAGFGSSSVRFGRAMDPAGSLWAAGTQQTMLNLCEDPMATTHPGEELALSSAGLGEPYLLPDWNTYAMKIGSAPLAGYGAPNYEPPSGFPGECGGGGGGPTGPPQETLDLIEDVCISVAEYMHEISQDVAVDGVTVGDLSDSEGVFDDLIELLLSSGEARALGTVSCPDGLSFSIVDPDGENLVCPPCIGIAVRLAAQYGRVQHVLLSAELRLGAAAGYAANVVLPKIAGPTGHGKKQILDGIQWVQSSGTLYVHELKPNTDSGRRAMIHSLNTYASRLFELRARSPDLIIGNSGGTNPV